LRHPAPGPGLEKAPLGPPAWCKGSGDPSHFYAGSVRRTIEQFTDQNPDYGFLVDGAKQLCNGDPKNAVVQRTAQEILQFWINTFGESTKESVEELSLRLDKARWDADHDAACKANEVDDEMGQDVAVMVQARRALFYCGSNADTKDDVRTYLDTATGPLDQLALLGWVHHEAQYIAHMAEDFRKRALVQWVVDQIDFPLVDANAAYQLADKDYKGNRYVRVAISEALGELRLSRAQYDAWVKAATKDADWSSLLVDGPRKGIAAWNAAAAKYKDALQRSNEFEHAAMGPRRKAMAGCEAAMRKDVQALLKTLKHDSEKQLKQEIGDSQVGGLLLQRYTVCMAADGDAMAAREIYAHGLDHVRIVRGPREAAVYAATDALAAIRDDRPKFAIDDKGSFPRFYDEPLNEVFGELANKRSSDPIGFGVWHEKGVVKSATKSGKVVKIVFAPDKHKVPTLDCHFTHRIIMFDHEGTPIYDQSCKQTGTHIEDYSPDPITISAQLAGGITPGKFMEFDVARGKERPSMPSRVWTDKNEKKLAAWYGFEL